MPKPSSPTPPADMQQARVIAEHVKRINQWQSADDGFTQLCRRLHTSLDLDTMMEVFAEETGRIVPFSSMSYDRKHRQETYEFKSGKGGNHHCCYNLTVNGEALGSLRLNRRRRFVEDELMVLEQMISILVQPLRNAWRYREAISASLTDNMTGLGNNRSLHQTLTKQVDLANRHHAPVSLILCDLDHFKTINDTHGHLFGDEVLTRIGELLPEYVRGSDECFRYGGEEFAIVLPHTATKEAKRVAERIRKAIRETRMLCDGKAVSVTTSVGVASLQLGGDAIGLIRAADLALYEAKNAGRDVVMLEKVSA